MALPAIPPALYYIAAALFGADMAAKIYGQIKGLGLQEKQFGLAQKRVLQGTQLAKIEEKRIDELISRLIGQRREERAETREMEGLRMLMGSKDQQTAIMMALMQSLSQNRPRLSPAGSFPPSSIVSLLQ